jgi:DNA-binding IclR family transcriptional regulator
MRLPAHVSAVGRAMLAALPDEELRERYSGQSLALLTDHGPRSVDELIAQLAEVRRAGVAVDEGMTTAGITCLGAAVTGHEDVPAAAVGITYVAAQRAADEVEVLAARVRRAAANLSAALTGRPFMTEDR